MKSISQWQREIHDLAVEKGWYDGPQRNPLEMHALIASEVGEATNEARTEKPSLYFTCKATGKALALDQINPYVIGFSKWKPEGESSEIADVIIRCLDYAAYRGWDMEKIMQLKHDFNKEREYRHGNKKY